MFFSSSHKRRPSSIYTIDLAFSHGGYVFGESKQLLSPLGRAASHPFHMTCVSHNSRPSLSTDFGVRRLKLPRFRYDLGEDRFAFVRIRECYYLSRASGIKPS